MSDKLVDWLSRQPEERLLLILHMINKTVKVDGMSMIPIDVAVDVLYWFDTLDIPVGKLKEEIKQWQRSAQPHKTI